MVKFIVLSGFLGAGKTTTMIRAAGRLREAGHRVAVITNDQGVDLVDTAIAKASSEAVGEVTGGCFCCRFGDLLDTAQRLVTEYSPNIIIAESVGSCTDITATVIRPLRRLYGDGFEPAPMTTVVDPLGFRRIAASWSSGEIESDLMYLYRKQLEDADAIVVNKIDLLDGDELATIVSTLRARFPQTEVVTCSAAFQLGLDDLLRVWARERPDTGRDLEIDYTRYGAAEAHLAWLNETLELSSQPGEMFSPERWTMQVLTHLSKSCHHLGYTVGHIKLMITSEQGTIKASLTDSQKISVDQAGPKSAQRGRVILNARVQCEPHKMQRLVAKAVRAASDFQRITPVPQHERCFKPGQPVPTYRLASEHLPILPVRSNGGN